MVMSLLKPVQQAHAHAMAPFCLSVFNALHITLCAGRHAMAQSGLSIFSANWLVNYFNFEDCPLGGFGG